MEIVSSVVYEWVMKKVVLIAVVLIGFVVSPFVANAQEVDLDEISLGSAIPVQIIEKGFRDGDIITLAEGGGYMLAKSISDPLMFGVVSLEPALYLYDKNAKGDTPAIAFGKAYVRVSTEMGEIKKGDPITSSSNPGVGVKATNNGFILGTAIEEYKSSDPKQVGKILVAINPRFGQFNSNILSTLFSAPNLSLSATPLNALRYLVAGIIVIVSFYIGFRFFGRASLKGVEAMGRNPLAKKSIILVVVVNAFLTFGVMLIGLTIAYVVVVF